MSSAGEGAAEAAGERECVWSGVRRVLSARPGVGAHASEEHLRRGGESAGWQGSIIGEAKDPTNTCRDPNPGCSCRLCSPGPAAQRSELFRVMTMLITAVLWSPAVVGPAFPFNDPTLETNVRVKDLLGRMTLHEKVGMMFMAADMAFGNDALPKGGVDEPSNAIPRLGVPEFSFMGQGNVYRGASNGCTINCCSCFDGHNMSNCCHDGAATQFPQGTGVAATWNVSAAFEMGRISAEESRGACSRSPASPVATSPPRRGRACPPWPLMPCTRTCHMPHATCTSHTHMQ